MSSKFEPPMSVGGIGGGGGSTSATTTEVDLGSTPTFSGRFTITDAGISSTSKVLCWQAPGPYTGKGTRADEADMQPVNVTAVAPSSGSAVVYWETPPRTSYVQQTNDSPRRDAAGATFDRLANQLRPSGYRHVRVGRVRGNVKFSYVVFS